MVQLVFYGTEQSYSDDTELRCFCNTKNEIFIGIKENDLKIVVNRDEFIKFLKTE